MLDWNPGHWVYDEVHRGDVLSLRNELTGYDLVIMSDVIEHLPKSEAIALIKFLLSRNRNVLVSTPVSFFQQDIAENPFERHASHWDASDFEQFVYDLDIAGGAALVVLLAGQGALTPTSWHRKVNRVLDRIPYVKYRGAIRRAIKRPLVNRLSRRPRPSTF
jgi:hypothetical protein